jgi:hypothetical protein
MDANCIDTYRFSTMRKLFEQIIPMPVQYCQMQSKHVLLTLHNNDMVQTGLQYNRLCSLYYTITI